MLRILIKDGEVIEVTNESRGDYGQFPQPDDEVYQEGLDYYVDYRNTSDWLTPEVYDPKKGLQGDAEEDGHVICNHPGKPHEK